MLSTAKGEIYPLPVLSLRFLSPHGYTTEGTLWQAQGQISPATPGVRDTYPNPDSSARGYYRGDEARSAGRHCSSGTGYKAGEIGTSEPADKRTTAREPQKISSSSSSSSFSRLQSSPPHHRHCTRAAPARRRPRQHCLRRRGPSDGEAGSPFDSVHDSSKGMNRSRQMELHYINTGFPCTITESFMDFFEGLTYAHADFALADAFQDQANPYWTMMQTNSYKYGYSGAGNYYSYGHIYDMNDYIHRADGGPRIWDNPTPVNNTDSPNVVLQGSEAPHASASSATEECIQQSVHQNSSSPQVIWQDNIDPDNMTYEELLDLGEAVGTQSRGLSQEHISSLPVTKYKCGFFSRKKARRERCVICQMEYRRGDLQMALPCKHVYHASCVTRWLSINKVCPVCFAEVPGEEPKRQ